MDATGSSSSKDLRAPSPLIRGRWRRKRLRRAATVSAGAVVVATSVTYKATPAAACPFSIGGLRSYSGQASSSSNYDGVAANIYSPGVLTNPINSNEALSFHVTAGYNLGASDAWWLQTGFVRGGVPGGSYYSEMKAFAEAKGADGYAFAGRPDLSVPPGSNPKFKAAFNGNNNSYEYFFEAYMGTTWLGIGGLPYRYNTINAEMEARTPSNICLDYTRQGFGSDGTATYNPSAAMTNRGNGFGWSEWTGSVTPYNFWGYS